MDSWRKKNGDKSNQEVARTISHCKKPTVGIWQPTVPLWEKQFCFSVGSVPWRKIVEMKNRIHLHDNVVKWDASAAEEAFNNAKTRFYAKRHGIPCDIPLPDCNMYLDEIDWDSKIDPELELDLEGESMIPDANKEKHDNVVTTGNSVVVDQGTDWEDGEDDLKKVTNTSLGKNEISWDPNVGQANEAVEWNGGGGFHNNPWWWNQSSGVAIGYGGGETSWNGSGGVAAMGYDGGQICWNGSGGVVALGYDGGQICWNASEMAMGYGGGETNWNESFGVAAMGYSGGETNWNESYGVAAMGYGGGETNWNESFGVAAMGYGGGETNWNESFGVAAMGYGGGETNWNESFGVAAMGYGGGETNWNESVGVAAMGYGGVQIYWNASGAVMGYSGGGETNWNETVGVAAIGYGGWETSWNSYVGEVWNGSGYVDAWNNNNYLGWNPYGNNYGNYVTWGVNNDWREGTGRYLPRYKTSRRRGNRRRKRGNFVSKQPNTDATPAPNPISCNV